MQTRTGPQWVGSRQATARLPEITPTGPHTIISRSGPLYSFGVNTGGLKLLT